MAPESFNPGSKPDPRCDLYGLGVIAYHMAFNRQPYTGNVREVMQGHIGGNARFDHPTLCGKDTLAIIRKLMSYDPAARYQTATELHQAVGNILNQRGLGSKSRRPGTRAGSGSQSSNASGSGSSVGDFIGVSKFLEDRLGSETSIHHGGQIVHSTAKERLYVWVLLAAVLALAIGAYFITRHDSAQPEQTAAPTEAIDTSTE